MSALPIPFRRPQSALGAFLCGLYSGWWPAALCRPFGSSGESLSLLMRCVRWWQSASQCWIILLARSR